MTRKTRVDYESEITNLHKQIKDYSDSETLQKQLNHRIGKWQKLLPITVLVANNERKPWTSSELGLECAGMPLKSKTGYNQIGDYMFEIEPEIQTSDVFTGGLVVERKEVSDLYSTLMNSQNRARFNREIEKYRQDNRLNQMVVMVESTLEEFLSFTPSFNGRQFIKYPKPGASPASRMATIASLYAKGIPIIWCGSRAQAVKLYPQLVRQWCIKNYDKVISME